MKKLSLVMAMVLACVLLLSACGGAAGGDGSIVGKWSYEEAAVLGMEVSLEFTDAGKVTITSAGQSITGDYEINGDKLKISVSGQELQEETFKVEGDKLTYTMSGQAITFKKQ